jgi:hypothetical protein
MSDKWMEANPKDIVWDKYVFPLTVTADRY